jgi:hypothetical protein
MHHLDVQCANPKRQEAAGFTSGNTMFLMYLAWRDWVGVNCYAVQEMPYFFSAIICEFKSHFVEDNSYMRRGLNIIIHIRSATFGQRILFFHFSFSFSQNT